jgi:hypothetical protein
MSAKPLAISEEFIPFGPPFIASQEPPLTSQKLEALPQASAEPAFEAWMPATVSASRSPEVCPTPTITLERKDDLVSNIRIQCGCGKVIELTCLH